MELSACYHSVQHFLAFYLLSKNLKIKIRDVCSELLFYFIRKEKRLSVFENEVLRRIFGPMKDEVTK
jgi:hypothetical protein